MRAEPKRILAPPPSRRNEPTRIIAPRSSMRHESTRSIAPKGRREGSHGWSETGHGESRAAASATRGQPPPQNNLAPTGRGECDPCSRRPVGANRLSRIYRLPRSRIRWSAATLIFLVALSCSSLPTLASQSPTTRPAATQPARVSPAINPHWSPDGCASCHEMSGTHARPIPVAAVESICLRCHDGRQARSEPHPVGRQFGKMARPADWPAPDDKVTCITCHQVHPGGHPRAPRPADNPSFLRSGGGDVLTFCARCHAGAGEPQRRYNPHAAQIENGHVAQQSCAFCHTKTMPAGEKAVRTGEPALRADAISLCIGCHPTHLEWSPRSHIGAQATPRVLASLKSFTAAYQPPVTTQPATTFLPLAAGDTIVCSTCHNPHYQGVFPPGSVLAAGAGQPKPAAEQLRGLRSNLCGACHGK